MADLQPRSNDTLWILGGIGLLGLVAYMASRKQGNTLQPTAPATPSNPQAGFATNTVAYDSTALSDPTTAISTNALSGMPVAPGMFVKTPAGLTLPFMNGVQYAVGSVIHFGDGSIREL